MRHGASKYHLGGRVSVLGSPGESNILNNEAYGRLVVTSAAEDAEWPAEPAAEQWAAIGRRLDVYPNPFGSTTMRAGSGFQTGRLLMLR